MIFLQVPASESISETKCTEGSSIPMVFSFISSPASNYIGMEEGDYASKSTIQFLNNWFDYTVSREVRGKSQEEILSYLQEEMELCI